ncbi:MAG TPA: DMT family transporter [Ideonella sp.]|uniref:DMT family transporter n=1 Tax=Ideonella sp. TaxID=1929293 RepID=UPI002BA60541|nr:DMT family transporter [Ideonella sp.]HSI46886.1 DMT family transporter [Ideonella sp.]
MPWVFVLIWSTGFIVARFGMPHSPPMSFLAWRYALSVLAFGIWVRVSGANWPQGRAQWGHLAVTGLLMQAGYLGGVWSAVKLGMGAGTIALLVGLQPVLTALWLASRSAAGSAPGRGAARRQWLGLGLGLLGLFLVVRHKLGAGELHAANLALALLALAGITVGTLYQKAHVAACDVRSAGLVQMGAAFLVTLPLALLEPEAMDWGWPLMASMAWSVGVLTLGGSSLLYLLIQRGAATQVTSLMYLVPPCTALMAALLFGEPLTADMLAGMALTALGVALVVRQPLRA